MAMFSGKARLVSWNQERVLDVIDSTMLQRMTIGAAMVERDVKASMKGGGSPHIPSRPGQPPAIDTGAYRARIYSVAVYVRRRVRGYVISPSRQARALEFGYPPNNLAPRPHLRPSLMRMREPLRRLLGAPITGFVRGTGSR